MTALEETAETLRGACVGHRPEVDASVTGKGSEAGWNPALDQILASYTLESGWDGEGAPAPSRPLLAAAMRLATDLRKLRCPAPARAVVSLDGTIILEWQQSGDLVELELLAPGRAELTIHRTGRPTSHTPLSW